MRNKRSFGSSSRRDGRRKRPGNEIASRALIVPGCDVCLDQAVVKFLEECL